MSFCSTRIQTWYFMNFYLLLTLYIKSSSSLWKQTRITKDHTAVITDTEGVKGVCRWTGSSDVTGWVLLHVSLKFEAAVSPVRGRRRRLQLLRWAAPELLLAALPAAPAGPAAAAARLHGPAFTHTHTHTHTHRLQSMQAEGWVSETTGTLHVVICQLAAWPNRICDSGVFQVKDRKLQKERRLKHRLIWSL